MAAIQGAGNDGAHSYGNSNNPNGNFMNVPARRGIMDARFEWGATLGNIKDGTSTTIAIGEIVQGINPTDDSFGLWALVEAVTVTAYNDFADPTVLPPPAANIQTPNCDASSKNLNWQWCTSYTPYCNNNSTGVDPVFGCNDSSSAMTVRSYHAGGVTVGMFDGSVRLISNTIDPITWYSLFTSAGGETAGNF